MTKKLLIFISYARKDARDLALRLRDDLEEAGFAVWLDLSEVAGGGDFTQQIEKAIDQCDVFLALMSHTSAQSTWCRSEQLRALRKGKRVIPILVQADAEPPLHLEPMSFIDFSNHARYVELFRDLASDVNSGQAFQDPAPADAPKPKRPAALGRPVALGRRAPSASGVRAAEKRNAPAFRRHIRELQRAYAHSGRGWWTFFAFMPLDLHALAHTLIQDEITSPAQRNPNFKKSRWAHYVKFYFRPRTPNLYGAEGFFALGETSEEPEIFPVPAYLLFDLETVLLHPEARFADGDPAEGSSTYATPTHFQEMPFDTIYHDGWVTKDSSAEIIRHRKAQILVHNRIRLEGLQYIWLRSTAEYETLHSLLPAEVWQKWRSKITARTDYNLFHRKRPFISHVYLGADAVQVAFNMTASPQPPSFIVRVHVAYADGATYEWQDEAFTPNDDLRVILPRQEAYQVSVLLNGDLAYSGALTETLELF